MVKKLMQKIICILMIIVVSIFLLPEKNQLVKDTYAVESGDLIEIPEGHWQHSIYEARYTAINWTWGTGQRKIYEEWKKEGYKTIDDGAGLCYITAGGIDWILVAVAPIFGEPGDYLKVHVNDLNGEEKDYYMIICDTKNPKDTTAYYIGDKHYGHIANCSGWRGHCEGIHKHNFTWSQAAKHLNLLEFVWYGTTNTNTICEKYTNVEWISNGGNYFEHPDGPVGFATNSTGEKNNFGEAVGNIFRQIWDTIASWMDNGVKGTNKATVLYSLKAYNYNTEDWVWPYPGCSAIASYFGPRNINVAGASKYHKGIDIGGTPGDIEVAAKSGTISVTDVAVGTGYYVVLDADDTSLGSIRLRYLHCDPEFLVEQGSHVYAGQPIAKVGPHMIKNPFGSGQITNGYQSGPHLHFEVWINGEAVDPLKYVQYVDSAESI